VGFDGLEDEICNLGPGTADALRTDDDANLIAFLRGGIRSHLDKIWGV